MEKKTKKMVALEAQYVDIDAKASELDAKIKALDDYKPQMKAAQEAKEKAIQDLALKREAVHAEARKNRSDLELATVEMLAGTDTDFEEPTPRTALEQAS